MGRAKRVQGGRASSGRTQRVSLACSGYEVEALRAVAIYRGILQPTAPMRGDRNLRGTGGQLLRILSLQDVVTEYERLVAEGKIAA